MSESPIGPASIALGNEGRLLKHRVRWTRRLIWGLVPFAAVCAPLATTPWLTLPLRMVGLLCLVACMVGRAWCVLYIGERKARELVRVGPYSVVRNPLYVASFIGTLGAAMQSGTLTLPVLAALVFAAYYRITIAREEEYLRERHGAAYDAYVREVPRWWPKLSGWHDVPRVGTSPALVLRYLGEGGLFFVSVIFFEVVRALQDTGIVPVLLQLP